MKRIVFQIAIVFSGLLVQALYHAESALAQGFLITEHGDRFHLPRPRPIGRPTPQVSYAIKEMKIDASIKQQVASTQVTQVFQNTGAVQMEVSFIFPLPYDGAIDQLTFLVDGKEYEAKLLKADEARRTYEGYLRRNQDPALLEWMGTGMFKTSVFPVPAGASRQVTLRYSQLLRKDASLVDYLFPLSTARYTSKPLEKLEFRVAISDDNEIKNVYSPTHQLEIKRDDDRNVVVKSSMQNVLPSMDFRLVYDAMPGLVGGSLLGHWPTGDDQGYFVFLASPEINAPASVPLKKSVIFVVDQSGSMSGEKIEQAREAARFVLNNLRENDLFNIITYDSNVKPMSPELLRFDAESRQQAIGFINGINAGGMTNIDGALSTALAQTTDHTIPNYVVFLTDGLPTVGETLEMKISENCRQNNKHRARIICFGVGYDVNSRLLDRIARENNGQTEYVLPNENIEAAVARLYSKISSPVLTNLKVDFMFDDATVEMGDIANRIYPQNQTELFANSQLVLVGRYKKAGKAKIRLSGKIGDEDREFLFEFDFPRQGESNRYPFVDKLWAMRRIGEIIDLIDLEGKHPELINELVQLSMKHGIVTPFTSYLADENAGVRQLTQFDRNIDATTRGLADLDASDGEQGFNVRSDKQAMKLAENLAQSPGQYRSAPRDIGGGGLGGGGLGGGRIRSSAGQSTDNNSSDRELQGIRKIGNHTFYKRDRILFAENAIDVDVERDAKQINEIARFSDQWFDLTKNNSADENFLLAQQGADEELVVRLQGKIYRIK
ncbi:MAG TPA: VIT domain-containing protein [Pirellulaceae bacterium]|nr:VIT domain-containing protein [Pirellulaceae bacterium]HMO90862.1 VIT domain-containing protein [Pirellulaceae bacterium]HMP68662.1 VIT domain-containing protein [Pirellulaceae bacterium]